MARCRASWTTFAIGFLLVPERKARPISPEQNARGADGNRRGLIVVGQMRRVGLGMSVAVSAGLTASRS